MDSTNPAQKCGVEALDVASKQRSYLYSAPDGAIKALRRACKGLTVAEALQSIETATRLLEEAIRIVEPRDNDMLEDYRNRSPNGPSPPDRAKYEQELALKFPGCTQEAVESALQRAVVYHII